MDMQLIEVAIGLVLVYAALSVLLMQIQEHVHGQWLRGRVQNLHRLVFEAVGQDDELRTQLYRNPLLFALSTGDEARPGGVPFITLPRGPSAIPPDLFARALLMELNQTGRHPSEDHESPLLFIEAAEKSAKQDSARGRLLRGLRGIMAGRDGDWAGFEAAIAKWFSDIGDRSTGWFKRRSGQVGLVLALLLCAGLNVDTSHLAATLGRDDELRSGFVRLAEQTLAQRDGAASAPAATATIVLDHEVRATGRLVDALARLREAYRRDLNIAAYGYDLYDLRNNDVPCRLAREDGVTIPNSKPQTGVHLTNSDTWLTLLPRVQARLEVALHRSGGSGDLAGDLADVHQCLTHVSAWVRAAGTASSLADTRRLMQEAAVALEDSKASVLALLRSSRVQGSLRQLFRQDPEAYERCARSGPRSVGELESCIRDGQSVIDRLPIGYTGPNRRSQFCTVIDAGKATDSRLSAILCGETEAPALAQFGDKGGMRLSFEPIMVLPWFFGILVSALFVSLGAPFWFDLLSKLVRVRTAGAVREASESQARGAGFAPLPAPAPAAATTAADGARSGGLAGTPSTLAPVEGASNVYEDQLLPREIQALQQRLDVKPVTGRFDDATRAALRRVTRDLGLGETDRLSMATYIALMGRPPVQAGAVTGAPVLSSRARLGEAHGLAQSIGEHLEAKLGFPARLQRPIATITPDLRAMAVLFRYRADANPNRRARQIFDIADGPGVASLDEIDEATIRQILQPGSQPFARSTPPWLDWAIGELGQVERNVKQKQTSNQRICDYLDAAQEGLSEQGDATPWCAAFVSWVLARHNEVDKPMTPQHLPAKDRAAAASWIGWQAGAPLPNAQALQARQPPAAPGAIGDVAVVNVTKPDGKPGHHVGFVFDIDPAQQVMWLLGGNQTGGTRVSLSRFRFTDLA
jgi:hypothetical protein